jgi:hypothetical protein
MLKRSAPDVARERHVLKPRSGGDLLPLPVTQPDRNNRPHAALPQNARSRSLARRSCSLNLLLSSTRRTASAASHASLRRLSAFARERRDASLWHSEHHDDKPSPRPLIEPEQSRVLRHPAMPTPLLHRIAPSPRTRPHPSKLGLTAVFCPFISRKLEGESGKVHLKESGFM